jgi:hypothetical protein
LIWAAASVLLAATVAGCGSGDSPSEAAGETAGTSAAEADPAAFCEASVDLGSALRGELVVGLNTAMSPEQAVAALDQFRDQVLSLLPAVQDSAPEELSGDVTTLTDEVRRAFETDDPAALRSPEFLAADGAVDQYMLDECGYEQLEVTGVNYEYENLPDALPAEVVAVTFHNEGDEMHEVGFARINDEVNESVEQVLATPLDQLFTKIDFTGLAIAPPGQADTVFFEFTPGRYAAACFIPQGTKHDAVGTGPPHFTLGMLGELTIA